MIYINQGYALIELDTGLDLSSATEPKIKYRKPDGSTGEYTGVISGTKVTYQPSNSDFDQAGLWMFQAWVKIGGLNAFGQVVQQQIEPTI